MSFELSHSRAPKPSGELPPAVAEAFMRFIATGEEPERPGLDIWEYVLPQDWLRSTTPPRPPLPPTPEQVRADRERKMLATLDRTVGMPCLKTAELFAATGHFDAAELLREFVSGGGSPRRIFPAGSAFSRGFARSETTRRTMTKALGDWRNRPGGFEANNGKFTEGGGTFVPLAVTLWFTPTGHPIPGVRLIGTPEAHVIGSINYEAKIINGDLIEWHGWNEMGLRSFFLGAWLSLAGLPTYVNRDRPGPYGTTRQDIHWITTKTGLVIG